LQKWNGARLVHARITEHDQVLLVAVAGRAVAAERDRHRRLLDQRAQPQLALAQLRTLARQRLLRTAIRRHVLHDRPDVPPRTLTDPHAVEAHRDQTAILAPILLLVWSETA